MPLTRNGQVYYRSAEVCRMVGISRSTFFRWLKKGIFREAGVDRRGWRLFAEDEVNRLNTEANRIIETSSPSSQ